MKPEKLILDYSKWRCGGDGKYHLGSGSTCLLNNDGFSCCLGQWSKQLGAVDSDIYDKKAPGSIDARVDLYPFTEDWVNIKHNTLLSYDCMHINDDLLTTPDEKIIKLKRRLLQENIQLEVINKP